MSDKADLHWDGHTLSADDSHKEFKVASQHCPLKVWVQSGTFRSNIQHSPRRSNQRSQLRPRIRKSRSTGVNLNEHRQCIQITQACKMDPRRADSDWESVRFQPCIPSQEVAKHRNNGIISRAPAKGQILILISTLRHESGTKKAFLDLLHMDMRLQ